jgi:glutathione S-transferase
MSGSLPRTGNERGRRCKRRRIAAYLACERRIPFNQSGIFRRYPQLDR